jgi:DNA-binding ferritin-like protein
MNAILADVFALYLKTKNFHWHMSGPHFRDHHSLLDEQAEHRRQYAPASAGNIVGSDFISHDGSALTPDKGRDLSSSPHS